MRESPMIEQEVESINKLGLHARASAKLVNTAAKFASKIEIQFASQTADAKSIMAMMIKKECSSLKWSKALL